MPPPISRALLLLSVLAALFVMSDRACSDTGSSIYTADAAGHAEKAGVSLLAFQEWMPEGRFFSMLVLTEWKRRESGSIFIR